jgi:hypothetical protein
MIRLFANHRDGGTRSNTPRPNESKQRRLAAAFVVLVWAACGFAMAVEFVAYARADDSPEAADMATDPATTDPPTADPAAVTATVDGATEANVPDAAETAGADEQDKSRFIRAKFSDGTLLVGELLLDELEVETDFGTLIVPRRQLLGVTPGLDTRSGFDERLDGLITALVSADKAAATAAERELMRLGPALADELDRRADELDGDAAKRIVALRDRLAEAEFDADAFGDDDVRPLIRKDRVRTTRFTIVGRIVPQSLRFKSRYGEIEAGLADIVAVERQSQDEREDVAKSFSVTGQNLVQTQMKRTGVAVRKGDQIVVRATGMIRRTAATSTYVSSPDGSSRFGAYSTDPQILGGTLIAKIGNKGNPIKIGSNAKFIAKQDGVLSFGVAMRPDYVGRYPFPGEYNVKLRVQRGK